MSVPDAIDAKWPAGPLFYDLPRSELLDARAWTTYKLTAGDWYIDTLRRLIEAVGFDRYVGIEMALDGAFTSINGAFDASIRGLIQTADSYFLQDMPAVERTPPHQMNADVFAKRTEQLEAHGFETAAIRSDVQAALERDSAKNPVGWLERFRRIRNLPTHQNTAARHYDVSNSSAASVGLSVGDELRDPVQYLMEVREDVADLTRPILDLCDLVAPHGLPTHLRHPV